MSETLVVVSKVKKHIKDSSGMNTSQTAIDEMTRQVLSMCEAAVANAANDGRKTVMDRDVQLPSRVE